MTTKPFNPFLFYSNQLERLFVRAAKQKNPAWWLYKNGARGSLFMLEALTRIHHEAFDEKVFMKWNKRFKKLEDLFGIIDYYYVFEVELKGNKKVSKSLLPWFSNNKLKYVEKCNKQLQKKNWLTGKLLSFDTKLNGYEISYNDEYLNTLKQAIVKEINTINVFCADRNYSFTLFDEEVHEMRRKLRWLSIYAQALNGLIQLKKVSSKPKYNIHYLTKTTLNSPFNHLPAKPKHTAIMEYYDGPFFALSWMINELGIIKDNGLKIQAVTDAVCDTEKLTEHQAKEKALKLLGLKNDVEKELLKKASEITHVFMTKDKILDHLVVK